MSPEAGAAPCEVIKRHWECTDASVWEQTSYIVVSSPLRFKKGFESEPTLHSGINYAVLLLAAGHQFDSSFELRKVGEWIPDGACFVHFSF